MSGKHFLEVGLPDEWDDFAKRHRTFLERFPNLERAFRIAFNREGHAAEPVDRVVFFSGRLCVEDFMEVLLLCGNGYGIGALKILRGMYERAVTARYLHMHPEEADNFVDFQWVSQRRLGKAIQATFGEGVLAKEKPEEVEAKYDEVRERFMVTDCKKCNTKRLNYTWSELDFVSMAHACGSIGSLIVPGYYIPTRQAHSTIGAILSRLKESETGGLEFDATPQRDEADNALITAHNLLLNVIDLQKEHFNLTALEKPLQTCFQDFLEVWKRQQKQDESGG
jgi:hypothetical protein